MLPDPNSSPSYKAIRQKWMLWGRKNARNYPWMGISDPYKIWLSEIILQQTRVEQGLPYYLAFVKAFPTICDLAKAEEDEVLLLWQGLGYYSRARNLLATAREVCFNRNGAFPESAAELVQLKGIGPYTSAAIASFAFGEPVAAIDGNAIRVISRLFGVKEPVHTPAARQQFELLAGKLIDQKQPGFFNQAVMDLGSGICLPKNPDCKKCPLSSLCHAFQTDSTNEFPVKTQKVKREARFYNFVLMQSGEHLILEKRNHKGIWAGLYQFPLFELPGKKELNRLFPDFLPEGAVRQSSTPWKKHILTHRDIWFSVSRYRLQNWPQELPAGWMVVKQNEISNFAFPKPLEQYIKSIDYLHS